MAALTTVYTLDLVTERLGEDADWLWQVSCEMDPEDGCLSIFSLNEEHTVAFSDFGSRTSSSSSGSIKPIRACWLKDLWTAECRTPARRGRANASNQLRVMTRRLHFFDVGQLLGQRTVAGRRTRQVGQRQRPSPRSAERFMTGRSISGGVS